MTTRADIQAFVVQATGVDTITAQAAVKATFEAIGRALSEGETVRIKGFGSFQRTIIPARKMRNPSTGGVMDAPENARVKFSAYDPLRRHILGVDRYPEDPETTLVGERERLRERRAARAASVRRSRERHNTTSPVNKQANNQ